MKNVVGQMPRYSLARTLKQVQAEYKVNSKLQQLTIPDVLGGEVDMILGSKYLKIYPEAIQVTPSGLTVSRSRLRSPGGTKAAVISGPVKFLNQIFESMNAKDCLDFGLYESYAFSSVLIQTYSRILPQARPY